MPDRSAESLCESAKCRRTDIGDLCAWGLVDPGWGRLQAGVRHPVLTPAGRATLAQAERGSR